MPIAGDIRESWDSRMPCSAARSFPVKRCQFGPSADLIHASRAGGSHQRGDPRGVVETGAVQNAVDVRHDGGKVDISGPGPFGIDQQRTRAGRLCRADLCDQGCDGFRSPVHKHAQRREPGKAVGALRRKIRECGLRKFTRKPGFKKARDVSARFFNRHFGSGRAFVAVVANAEIQKKFVLIQQAKAIFFVVRSMGEPHEIGAFQFDPVGPPARADLGRHGCDMGPRRRAGGARRKNADRHARFASQGRGAACQAACCAGRAPRTKRQAPPRIPPHHGGGSVRPACRPRAGRWPLAAG